LDYANSGVTLHSFEFCFLLAEPVAYSVLSHLGPPKRVSAGRIDLTLICFELVLQQKHLIKGVFVEQ
jgi:hypothetical protein